MRYLAIPALLVLTACDTPIGTEVLRFQAKGVVDGVVQKYAPGIDVTPISDCVIDNASGSEIVEIGGASVSGVTSETTDLVLDIATRQNTLACYEDSVGPMITAGLLLASL